MYYRLYFIYIICQWYLISLCYSNTSPELVRIEEYIAILTDQLTEDVTNPQLWAEIAAARHEYTHFSNIYKYNNSLDALYGIDTALKLGLQGNAKLQALHRRALILLDIHDRSCIPLLKDLLNQAKSKLKHSIPKSKSSNSKDTSLTNYDESLILNDLGYAWITFRDYDEATIVLKKAIKRSPYNMESYMRLFHAMELYPNVSRSYWKESLSEIKLKIEEMEDDKDILDNQRKNSILFAHRHKSKQFSDSLISSKSRSYTDDNKFSNTEEDEAYWALHIAAHRVGKYHDAWNHLIHARSLYLKSQPKSSSHVKQIGVSSQTAVDKMKGVFSSNGFWPQPSIGSNSKVPLFFVGLPCSGSTLLGAYLGQHPSIKGPLQHNFFESYIFKFREELLDVLHYGWGAAQSITQHYAKSILSDMKKALNTINRMNKKSTDKVKVNKSDKRHLRIIDQTGQNYKNIGMIHLMYPKAAIINIVRDPMDTILSILRTRFSSSSHIWTYTLSGIFTEMIAYYDMMHHWDEVLPGRVIHIQYSCLVKEPGAVLRQLLTSLDLKWSDAVLKSALKHESTSSSSIPFEFASEIASSSLSLGSWTKYEKELNSIKQTLLQALLPLIKENNLPFPDVINWSADSSFDYSANRCNDLEVGTAHSNDSDMNNDEYVESSTIIEHVCLPLLTETLQSMQSSKVIDLTEYENPSQELLEFTGELYVRDQARVEVDGTEAHVASSQTRILSRAISVIINRIHSQIRSATSTSATTTDANDDATKSSSELLLILNDLLKCDPTLPLFYVLKASILRDFTIYRLSVDEEIETIEAEIKKPKDMYPQWLVTHLIYIDFLLSVEDWKELQSVVENTLKIHFPSFISEKNSLSEFSSQQKELLETLGLAYFQDKKYRKAIDVLVPLQGLHCSEDADILDVKWIFYVAEAYEFLGETQTAFEYYILALHTLRDRSTSQESKDDAMLKKITLSMDYGNTTSAFEAFNYVFSHEKQRGSTMTADQVLAMRSRSFFWQLLGNPEQAVDDTSLAIAWHTQQLQHNGNINKQKNKNKEGDRINTELDSVEELSILYSFRAEALQSLSQFKKAADDYHNILELDQRYLALDSSKRYTAIFRLHYLTYLHNQFHQPLISFNVDNDLSAKVRLGLVGIEILTEDERKSFLQDFGCKDGLPRQSCSPNFSTKEDDNKAIRNDRTTFMIEALSVTAHLKNWVKLDTAGFIHSSRYLTMYSLAVLHVAQLLGRPEVDSRSIVPDTKTSQPLDYRNPEKQTIENNKGTHQIGWRDVVDTVVRWRRISHPKDMVWWLDCLPPAVAPAAGMRQTALTTSMVSNGKRTSRYGRYYDRGLQELKATMIENGYFVHDLRGYLIGSHNNTDGMEHMLVDEEDLSTIHAAKSLFDLHQFANNRDIIGFARVSSLIAPKKKKLQGMRLYVEQREEGLSFDILAKTNQERYEDYESEINFAFKKLKKNVNSYRKQKKMQMKSEEDDKLVKEILNDALDLFYIWVNWTPVSRGTSIIGYILLSGAMLAVGHEFASSIPKDIQLDWEAFFAGNAVAFRDNTQFLRNLKKSSISDLWLEEKEERYSLDSLFSTMSDLHQVFNLNTQTILET